MPFLPPIHRDVLPRVGDPGVSTQAHPPQRRTRLPSFWITLFLFVILSGARSAQSKDLLSFRQPWHPEGKQVLRLHSAALRFAQHDGEKIAQASTPVDAQASPQQTTLPGKAAQTATPPVDPAQTTPPPKGKVLFERHDPTITDEPTTSPATPADTPPEANPTGKTGVSSSTKRSRTTLHRRADQPAAAGDESAPPVEPPPAPTSGVSSSVTDEQVGEAGPVIVTAQDREAASRISATERGSVAVTATNLDLHLNAHTGDAEARAQLIVRNTGDTPLQHVPLRISGALRWESARIQGTSTSLPLEQHHLPDDLDHTGVSTELAMALPQPLAPGASVALDLYYGGTLSASAQRLLTLGAPASRAALTDWDTVTDTFTGLRGLGEVLWYPTTTPPALLRDGSAVTDAVEKSRARGAASSFHLRLTLAYEGSQPDAAFFCGERQALKPLLASAQPASESGAVVAEWTRSPLGSHTPSLFVASGAPAGTGTVRVMTADPAASAAVDEAAGRIRPMLAEWLGAAQERPLQVLDLPIPGAAAFDDGSLLVAPLGTQSNAASLAASLVQPMVNAWLPDGIAAPWLRDGLPAFLQAVWAERTAGRAIALANLAATDAALRARSEPAAAAYSSSQDTPAPVAALATCTDAACTRGKAAYVFEMLRDMLGDAALQQAISGWRVQAEGAHRTAAEETSAMEKLLQQTAGSKDLGWFFRNWIDAGRSLPDLTIVTVAPRRVERSAPTNYLPEARKPVAGPIGAEPVPQQDERRPSQGPTVSSSGGGAPAPGSWLVAVEVQNNGGTDVEVPVTVRNGSLTNTLPLRVAAGSRATIRVPFEAEPEEVMVNDGSVPEAHTTQHRRSIRNLPPAR